MLKFFKDLLLSIRLFFTIKKEEVRQSNSEYNSVLNTDATSLNTTFKKEQEVDNLKFDKINNLVLEFAGEAPIVYASDGITIRKEDQYGYLRDLTSEELRQEEQELLIDDISLMGDIDKSIYSGDDIIRTIKLPTANYLNEKQEFEVRWEDIKRRARQEKPDSEEDEETDLIDGIIKE